VNATGHASQLGLHLVSRRGAARRRSPTARASLATVGLFSGIGGIELGLARAGHESLLLCENDSSANAVLAARFPDTPKHDDVRTLAALPSGTQLLAGGFPCQDLSQAGKTAGIAGSRSGLVGEVFRLLRNQRVPWLLLENVPFMLQLARGQALEVIVAAAEDLGYRWAYRVIDSRAFGVPQRRQRVYFLASLESDPRDVLLVDDAGPREREPTRPVACGFYWTEGVRGLGWAVDAVPTLKGGSTIGIPSAPAILLPSGDVVKPDLRDMERMQGFVADWTKPAEAVAKRGARYKLVGNAVTVDVVEWIGHRLLAPRAYRPIADAPLRSGAPWPNAAYNVGTGRYTATCSMWPVRKRARALERFLQFPPEPLSAKATAGFLARARSGSLRFPPGFLDAVENHLRRMEAAAAA
jgi:DNA (cytosine-5)-methyltransferase 1